MDLTQKKCIPCEAGTLPLEESKIIELLKEIPSWTLKNSRLLSFFKFYYFKIKNVTIR